MKYSFEDKLNMTAGRGHGIMTGEEYLESLRDDVTTLKGWFKNPATRILMVFFFSNLGSGIGTWVAGFQIFDALS